MTYVPTPDVRPPKVRPRAWWYLLVPLLFVGGIVSAILAGVDEATDMIDSFQRTGPGGVASIELDAGDEATVFALWDDGRRSEDLERPAATVTVVGPDGSEVPFRSGSGGRMTFSTGSDAGIGLGKFEARASGRHEVKVEFDPQPEVVLPVAAVGRLDFTSLFRNVLGSLGFGVVASIVAWIVLLVMRGSSKRRIRNQPQYVGVPTERAASTDQPPPPSGQGPISFN